MTDIERNKQVVRDFCEVAFNAKQPADAAQRFMGAEYIQHNPTAPDGKDGFIEFATAFVAQAPDLNLEIRTMIAEDDLVMAHSLLKVTREDAGMVVVREQTRVARGGARLPA